MTQETAVMIFKFSWGLLLAIAVLSQILFEDKPKKKAGFITNLLIITPFVIVLGLFYFGRYFGVFESTLATRIEGTVIVVLGMVGYILSLLSLLRNWSLSASIKEGHKLVKSGPYKLIRHPMYSSTTVIVLGSGLLIANYIMILFTPLVGIVYYIRAGKEEALLRGEFPDYDRYAGETRILIPGIF
jgi:protein-S-isoprenylcysteine O-methyltransferase Ste14